jgi:hypothetical protein
MVANDGVPIETFYSPDDSRRTVLNEQQVNEILIPWVANCKQAATEAATAYQRWMRKKLY